MNYNIVIAIADRSDFRTTKIIEPKHDKTNKMTCAPSEDSNQPGHPPSLIRVFALCAFWVAARTQPFFMRTAKTDQTGWMPRLI